MIKADPRYASFYRRPPADLEDAPLSEVLRAMSVTASILEAFGYRQRPLGRWRRLVWDSPQSDNGKPRATVETSDSCAAGVVVEVGESVEVFDNDLALIVRLVELSEIGIGRLDVHRFVVAVKNLVLSAAGYDPEAMPIEVFAAIVAREPRADREAE